MKYLQYLWYLLRHKWFVFIACIKEDLWLLGILHDWSKFRPSEFIPYARYFHKKGKSGGRDKTGYYKPTDTGDSKFDFAWLLHQKRNKHHWQWWILPNDSGGIKAFEITPKYRAEMICDWIGASRAQKHSGDVHEWWAANNHKMLFHPRTRAWIEAELEVLVR